MLSFVAFGFFGKFSILRLFQVVVGCSNLILIFALLCCFGLCLAVWVLCCLWLHWYIRLFQIFYIVLVVSNCVTV